MVVKYSTRPLKANQIRTMARKAAREAGLDADTADAVAHRVIERLRPHVAIEDIIQQEINRHAHP